jgi:hypothetical protein
MSSREVLCNPSRRMDALEYVMYHWSALSQANRLAQTGKQNRRALQLATAYLPITDILIQGAAAAGATRPSRMGRQKV